MLQSEFFKISPKFVGKNSALPMLECLKIEVGRLMLTDLESTLFVWGDCTDWISSEINTCIPYDVLKKLYTKCPKLKKDTFRLYPGDEINEVKVSIDGATIFTIKGLKIDYFPTIEVPNMTGVIELTNIDVKAVKNMALKFTSRDELRVSMTGVYFDEKNICATNAHILKKRKLNNRYTPGNFIVPWTTCVKLPEYECDLKYPAPDQINIDGHTPFQSIVNVEFKYLYRGFTIITRVIDANYPDYTAVIPSELPGRIVLDRSEVLGILDMALLAVPELNNLIKVNLSSTVTFEAENIDDGLKFYKTAKVLSMTGDDMLIGLDCKNFQIVLKDLDTNTFTIDYSAPNRCVLIDTDSLIMPIVIR